MAALVLDTDLQRTLVKQRQAWGGDRYDEVWEGVYVMPPLANNDHQFIVTRISRVLSIVVEDEDLGVVLAGANVSDQPDDWKYNYRCPDVVVVLKGGRAENRGTHWYQGPDFLVEVASPNDRSLDKLEFYAGIGVRELLVIGRDNRHTQLYRLAGGELVLVGRSDRRHPDPVISQVLPLSFRWAIDPASQEDRLQVARTDARPGEWFV